MNRTSSVDGRAGQPTALGLGPREVGERARAIRREVLRTIGRVGEGYLLQGLGAAEIFASLYFSELRLDPAFPANPDRDRCLLCAAHNSVALYATLAMRGYFPIEDLERYGADDSDLEIIASEAVPGVEGTFGSLGQGLSVAVGVALSGRLQGRRSRAYAILGDGEMQEGQTWEAAMAAAAYRLDNLCVVLDLNGMQVEGAIDDVLPIGAVRSKWEGFGWAVLEVDGNDAEQLLGALRGARRTTGRPSMIVAKTRPGFPIVELTDRLDHRAALSPEQAERALAELEAGGAEIER